MNQDRSDSKPRPAAPVAAAGPVPDPAADRSVVRRLWDVFVREPMLMVTCGYLFVSVIGLWDSYWFYRRFDIPVLEFMQSSDYFVAGLRRPVYAVSLLYVLAMGWLTLLPDRWSLRYPQRAERLRARWWGRALVPRRSDWWSYGGLHPETLAMVVSIFVLGSLLWALAGTRAETIRRGGGHPVEVTLAGASASMPGDQRLLGTSSAFVFLWDAVARRAELVPIESVGKIRPRLRQRGPAAAPVPDGGPDER